MTDLVPEKFVTSDMVELTDKLSEAVADMVEKNLRLVLKYDFSEYHAVFDNKKIPGEFDLFVGPNHELKIKAVLSEIVDATIVCRDDDGLLDGLANELERLALLIRRREKY